MRAGIGAIHSTDRNAPASTAAGRMIIHPATTRNRRFGFVGSAPADRLRSVLAARLDDAYHWFRSVAPGGEEPMMGAHWVDTASGEFNGVWDGGPTGRGSICAGAGGTIILYTGGNAQTPCGTIIVADQTLTGNRGGDPHTECPN